MKKLIFISCLFLGKLNAQTLVECDSLEVGSGVSVNQEVQQVEFKVIEYHPETFQTLRTRIMSAEYMGDDEDFKAVDEDGEFWYIKKKKKKSTDSKINVVLSSNYPPEGMSRAINKKLDYKRSALVFLGGFISGAARGLHETIHYHYSSFKRVHPNANDKFWNPEISWLNKYEDYPTLGKQPNYFGSTTFLAWTTDAKHLTDAINTGALVGSTCLFTIGEKRKWWEYIIDMGVMFAGRSAGFYLTYDVIYK